METSSLLFALEGMISRVVADQQVDEFNATLVRMLLGSRNQYTQEEAVNVLTQIDRMSKRYNITRTWYDALSEFAHPNYAGVLVSYGTYNPEIFSLKVDNERSGKLGAAAMFALCANMELALAIYNDIEQHLPSLWKLCEGTDKCVSEEGVSGGHEVCSEGDA